MQQSLLSSHHVDVFICNSEDESADKMIHNQLRTKLIKATRTVCFPNVTALTKWLSINRH